MLLGHSARQPDLSGDKLRQGLLSESVNALKNALCDFKNHHLNQLRLLTTLTIPASARPADL
jgi:hypothetical protein